MTREEIKNIVKEEKTFVKLQGMTKVTQLYYKNLNYKIQKNEKGANGFFVSISDLTLGSHFPVNVMCEDCGVVRKVKFYSLVSHYTSTRCNSCNGKSKGTKCKHDLTGLVFHSLTVIEDTGERSGTHPLWLCRCVCGKFTVVSSTNLVTKHTKSCGCYRKEVSASINGVDLINKQFGRLKVLEKTNLRKESNVIWKCLCECGNITYVRSVSLLNGATQSCGCLANEQASLRMIKYHEDLDHNIWSKLSKEDKRILKSTASEVTSFNAYIAKTRKYMCEVTGKFCKGKHAVHHLFSKTRYPDLALIEDNVVLLTVELHRDFHSKYGYGDNTLAQFTEWQKVYNNG